MEIYTTEITLNKMVGQNEIQFCSHLETKQILEWQRRIVDL